MYRRKLSRYSQSIFVLGFTKKLITACFTSFFSFLCYSQTPGWQWVQRGGGDGFPTSTSSQPDPDEIYASAIDKEGNLIVGGKTSWYPVFDTVHVNGVNWLNPNFFLAKYNSCGELLWVRVGGGDGVDIIEGLDVDEEGNIYTQGYLQSAGSPVYIHTPNKDTTFNAASLHHFMKFDKDGNLLYLKTTLPNIGYMKNGFKRLKSGNFLTVYVGTNSPLNLGSFTIPANGRAFVLLDSLGNILKAAIIDTLQAYSFRLGNFVVDENENIYIALVNLAQPSITMLSHQFSPAAQYSAYLVKTDTSFIIKDWNNSGYYNEAPFFLSYSNGYLYGVGRNTNGAVYETDTFHTSYNYAVYSCYKIDTNLHFVWSSYPSVQNVSPLFTYELGGASKDNVYITMQTRGTLVWDSANLVVPSNNAKIACLRLRASDGKCINGFVAGGANTLTDEVTGVTTDAQGNAYFMGKFTSSIGTYADTVYCHGSAPSPDYYILKWGLDCQDTLNSLNSPVAPFSLTATATGTQSVDVIWHDASQYEQGFHLYRSPDGINNWTLIDSTASNTAIYTDVNVQPNTIYWYKVAAYNGSGESAFSNIDSAWTWPTACSANITYSNIDSVYTLAANPSGSGTLSYQWSLNGSAFDTAAMPQLTLGTPGTYSICVSVTDAFQCSASDCDTITISPFTCGTTVSYTISNDTVYNLGTTNTGTSPYTYQWSVDGSAYSTAANPALPLTVAGSYHVCVTVTDANQCQAADCETIVITGISEWKSIEARLFPNPAQEAVHVVINSATTGTAQLLVTDLVGRVVLSETIQLKQGANMINLNSEGWTEGVYEIKLQTTEGRWSGAVVKY